MKNTTLFALTLLIFTFGNSVFGSKKFTLAQFKVFAGRDKDRCSVQIKGQDCLEELDYALKEKFIDKTTYNWGKTNGHYPVFIKRGKEIAGVCKCGCFEASTKILLDHGWQKISEINEDHEIKSLSPNSSIILPDLIPSKIKTIVNGPQKSKLFKFFFKGNGSISVTQHHGMVMSDGKMKTAKEVKIGESFRDINGKPRQITNIKRVKTNHNVYNVATSGKSTSEHIIAANEILIGDLSWQNQNKQDLTGIQLRMN